MNTGFLPTTPEELHQRGWDALDVILVTGDSYIDSPFIGVAVIGRVLERAGFRVGIIAQPHTTSPDDITRLGEPRLFWGVTGGSIDSMVANYTASGRKRKSDDYTPGGVNDRRPNRAVIVYSNLIRRYYKQTRPIVLGGIEASLRRVAHYDYWSKNVRRSILFDAKADYLLYGMADRSVLELTQALNNKESPAGVKGLCFISHEPPNDYLQLPTYETVADDKMAFMDMFDAFYKENDPLTARGLYQRHGDRYLVQNPPQPTPSQADFDALYDLPYQRAHHPHYEKQGRVKALETIRFSINTHRGCYGECNFCAIALHEGRIVHWRSKESILSEAKIIANLPDFKGYIHDLGGPTANMYGYECKRKYTMGCCADKRCVYPVVCNSLKPDHRLLTSLMVDLRRIPGIKKVFVASGIRYDLVMADKNNCQPYMEELVAHHVSGQLKLAPEHSEDAVLARMGKPGTGDLLAFKSSFDEISKRSGKQQYLTYYFIAAHPGCTDADMRRLKEFAMSSLHLNPEQVQLFTPLPSTYSSLMYYTGLDPVSRQPLFVEKDPARRETQKGILTPKKMQTVFRRKSKLKTAARHKK